MGFSWFRVRGRRGGGEYDWWVGIRILGSTDYYLIEGVYFNHEVGVRKGIRAIIIKMDSNKEEGRCTH